MSSKIDIEKYLDLEKFVGAVEEGARMEGLKIGENFAKRNVQVDNGELRDSIGNDGEDSIVARAPHARRQEYGRPGMVLDEARVVGIGYTPFLRPAAKSTAELLEKNGSQVLRKIIDAAIQFARIR